MRAVVGVDPSAEETSGILFRMPVVFGPSLGPRQGPNARPYAGGMSGARHQTLSRAAVRTDPGALAALLPPGFELRGEPLLYVSAGYLREIGWLAGRGYNIFAIEIPVTYRSEGGPIGGIFTPVVWENSPEAIMTGREELGMSKLYAEIPDLVDTGGGVESSVAWHGFEFARLTLSELEPAAVRSPAGGVAAFNYKYIPASGRWGSPDVAYVTMIPPQDVEIMSRRQGTARIEFRPGTWEDLPTMAPIVEQLAALPVHETRPGSVTTMRVTFDGRDIDLVGGPCLSTEPD